MPVSCVEVHLPTSLTVADLETEDYEQIFAVVPTVRKLVLRNACQFKDVSLEYMIEKATSLTFLQIEAANLVTNDAWIKLFRERGPDLEAVKLQWLDASFDDEAVSSLVENCTNLKRLKLERCRRITANGFEALSSLDKLEHISLQLSLQLTDDVPGERLIHFIGCVGHNLRTLSFKRFLWAEDDFLAAVHQHCRQLEKLRLTENDLCTDAGYAALFTEWANPPLRFIDLNSSRDIDSTNPAGPADTVGLGDAGLTALLAHSGSKLEHLDISSCRHISLGAFLTVFDGQTQYPRLRSINLSFCGAVDTTVIAGIFRSCPSLKKVVAFGCFAVEDVVVPRGIVLIGVPRAQDAIEQFGDAGLSVDGALGRMVEIGA